VPTEKVVEVVDLEEWVALEGMTAVDIRNATMASLGLSLNGRPEIQTMYETIVTEEQRSSLSYVPVLLVFLHESVREVAKEVRQAQADGAEGGDVALLWVRAAKDREAKDREAGSEIRHSRASRQNCDGVETWSSGVIG